MKKLLIFLFLALPFIGEAQILVGADGKGHSASADSSFTNSTDVKGVRQVVSTWEERNAIKPGLRIIGGEAKVTGVDSLYALIGGIENSNWVNIGPGNLNSGFIKNQYTLPQAGSGLWTAGNIRASGNIRADGEFAVQGQLYRVGGPWSIQADGTAVLNTLNTTSTIKIGNTSSGEVSLRLQSKPNGGAYDWQLMAVSSPTDTTMTWKYGGRNIISSKQNGFTSFGTGFTGSQTNKYTFTEDNASSIISPVGIQNKSSTGTSSVDFYGSTGALQLALGFANSGFSTPALAGAAYMYLPNNLFVGYGATGELYRWTSTGLTTGLQYTTSKTSLGIVSTDGALLTNTTAATSTATVQYSPRLRFRGNSWNTTATAASNTQDGIIELRPTTGATTGSNIAFAFSNNGGAYVDGFTVSSGGNTYASGNINNGGRIGINMINGASALLHFGTVNPFSTSAAFAALNGLGIRQDAQTYTSSSASGTITAASVNSFAVPTLAAGTAGTTISDAYNIYIAGGPLAGTNVSSITRSWAFGVGSGNSYFGGNLNINGLTASRALVSDASKNVVSSTVTSTELGYVSGVTSAIQTQINTKQATITFGTGVQTALGVNIGSAGAPVLFNGAGGTPSSMVGTNITGTAAGLTAGTVTNGVYTTTFNGLGDARYAQLGAVNTFTNTNAFIGAISQTGGAIAQFSAVPTGNPSTYMVPGGIKVGPTDNLTNNWYSIDQGGFKRDIGGTPYTYVGPASSGTLALTNGFGASGTWGIDISGNAATATNAVYTIGNQTIGGDKSMTGSWYFNGGSVSVTSALSSTSALGVSNSAVNGDGFSAYGTRYAAVFGDASTVSVKAAIYSDGHASFDGPVKASAGYTVATLPTGTTGQLAYVTDALTPTYLVAVVGGGAVVAPVFFNGSTWVAH